MVALSSAAYALGLGEILVKSKLNQPLDAEILVREATPGEAEQLVAKLASQEDFARLGLERARMPVLVRFDTAKNERGQTVIRVRSDEPVREPFLTLLVEANWTGGRLLREYGLLLDPPVTAPSSSITRVATAPPSAPAQTQALAETPPSSPEPPPVETVAAAPAPVEPAPVSTPTPAPAPAPAPSSRPAAPPPPGFAAPADQRRPAPAQTTPAPAAAEPPASTPSAPLDGTYTVQRGDNLSGIARTYAEAAGVTPNQMMLAIQRENPRAFFNDNINALKAGAVLRIPDADAARTVRGGEASAEVRRQNSSWTGVAALADAGSSRPTATQGRPSAPAGDRLELLPPGRDGSGNQGAGSAGVDQGGANVAGLQSDLQRAREDLRSREQELSELNSRVRDLEELNAKNSRLLELKNTELAELQRRLADATAATPSPSVAVAPPVPVATTPEPAVAEAQPAPVEQTSPETIEGVEAEPDVDIEAAAPASAQEQSEADWEAETTAGSDDPFAAEDAAGASTGDSWAPAEPVETPPATPVVQTPPPAPVTQAVQTPAPAAAEPWYMNPLIQGGALVAVALILLLLLLSRRKSKQAAVVDDTPRRSVADLFGDTPAAAGSAAAAIDESLASETQALVDQIEADPNDFGAYLELLSIHYSNNDAAQFELWAERFRDRPGSEISEEWQSVRIMGNELLAGHALFASNQAERQVWTPDEEIDVGLPDLDEPVVPVAVETPPAPARQVFDISGANFDPEQDKVEDLGDDAALLDFDAGAFSSVSREPERAVDVPAPVVDEPALADLEFGSGDSGLDLKLEDELDSFVGEARSTLADADEVVEEATGGLDDAATKLELARAYLDMGDPEGARAMLEEVLGEGDTSQREAARKLLASL